MFAAPFRYRPTLHAGDRLSSPPRRWMSILVLFAVLALHALSDHGTVLGHHVSGGTSEVTTVSGGAVSAAAGVHQAEQATAQESAGSAAGVAERRPPAHDQCCHLATSRGAAAAHAPALLAVQPRQGPAAPTDLRSRCAAIPDVMNGLTPGAQVLRV